MYKTPILQTKIIGRLIDNTQDPPHKSMIDPSMKLVFEHSVIVPWPTPTTPTPPKDPNP